MKKIFPYIIFLIIMFFVSNDSLPAKSFFNASGLGERVFYNNAQAIGMGGTAISLPDIYQINILNPAGLVYIPVTRLNGDFIHEAVWTKSQSANGFTKYTNLNGISLAIPLKRNTLVTAFGISPVSQFDYNFQEAGVINNYGFSKITKADGGLNKVTFGFGVSPIKRLAIGVYFNYMFGKLEKTWKVDYVSDLFWDSSDKLVRKIWGSKFSIGLMANPMSNLHVGAIYSFKNRLTFQDHILNSTKKGSYVYTIDQIYDEEKEMTLPAQLGLGMSYKFANRWRFAVDYIHEPWTKFKINDIETNEYKDRNRIGLGFEIMPSTNMLASYFDQMTYRIGYHYQTLDYLDDLGNSVTDQGLSIGFGFPYYNNLGRIDLALRISQRGDLSKNGVAENIFQIFISITGGEMWFVRQGQN